MPLPSQCTDKDSTDGRERTNSSQYHGSLLGVSLFIGLGGNDYFATRLYTAVVQTTHLTIGVYDESLAALSPTADTTSLVNVVGGILVLDVWYCIGIEHLATDTDCVIALRNFYTVSVAQEDVFVTARVLYCLD